MDYSTLKCVVFYHVRNTFTLSVQWAFVFCILNVYTVQRHSTLCYYMLVKEVSAGFSYSEPWSEQIGACLCIPLVSFLPECAL